MAITKLDIEAFLEATSALPVLDVRSPAEYAHAHIPGAVSFPLFTNDERAVIGTAYKQESREKAIKIGLDSFGRNMVQMVEQAEKIVAARRNATREVGVHCWRGGMRSAAVAWLLDLYGFKVYLLAGGYKAYRKHILAQFEKDWDLQVLSGYTGSNKTGLLMAMEKKRVKVLDLEGLARHKGSAYGNLEGVEQPGQEQFENLLAAELLRLSVHQRQGPIWVEAESQRMGSVNIPLSFFQTLRSKPMIFLDIPFEQRLAFIVKDYGKHDKDKLMSATLRIRKRLGGLETKNAINFLLEDDLASCFAILLKYYDKLYLKTTVDTTERKIIYVQSDTVDAEANLKKLNAYVFQS